MEYTFSGFEQFENGRMYEDEKIEGLNDHISRKPQSAAGFVHQMAYDTWIDLKTILLDHLWRRIYDHFMKKPGRICEYKRG